MSGMFAALRIDLDEKPSRCAHVLCIGTKDACEQAVVDAKREDLQFTEDELDPLTPEQVEEQWEGEDMPVMYDIQEPGD